MSNYKLVPVEPTPEMVEAAKDAYMPFGDMELALRMAILAAPAVQGEPVGCVKTMGGYPDESEHTVEWLCKYKDLQDGDLLYAAPQPAEQQPEVLASGYFHPLPDENDYEFHAEENFPDGNDCPDCEPAVIVRKSAVAIQPSPDVDSLVEALDLALVYWRDRQQRYKNRRPKWVVAAELALAAHRKQGVQL